MTMSFEYQACGKQQGYQQIFWYQFQLYKRPLMLALSFVLIAAQRGKEGCNVSYFGTCHGLLSQTREQH